MFFLVCIRLVEFVELCEAVRHDCRLLKAFLYLPLTVGSVGVMVMTPD